MSPEKELDLSVDVSAENQDYVVVRAEENGVVIFGLTRGKDTRLSHSEKLDRGEVMLMQFTQHISAVKVRGKARIYTRYGVVEAGDWE